MRPLNASTQTSDACKSAVTTDDISNNAHGKCFIHNVRRARKSKTNNKNGSTQETNMMLNFAQGKLLRKLWQISREHGSKKPFRCFAIDIHHALAFHLQGVFKSAIHTLAPRPGAQSAASLPSIQPSLHTCCTKSLILR